MNFVSGRWDWREIQQYEDRGKASNATIPIVHWASFLSLNIVLLHRCGIHHGHHSFVSEALSFVSEW
jgi:hypothetical protein